MTFTIDIQSNPLVGITHADVAATDEETIAFEVEGTLRVTDELLGALVGSRLTPTEIALACESGPPAEITLDEAGLRLEEIDVGVELPATDADDASDLAETAVDGLTDAAESDGAAPVDPTAPLDAAGRVAFTVEGVVANAPTDAVERIDDGEAWPASLTFAVDDLVESDGGSPGGPLVELELLGVRVAIRTDGTIVITALGANPEIDPV